MERSAEERKKRANEVKQIIEIFGQHYELCIAQLDIQGHTNISTIEIHPNFVETLIEEYYPIIDQIKLSVEVNADRHKIASLLELLTIRIQPIQVSDENEVTTRQLNARFAFTIAASFEMGLKNVSWDGLDFNTVNTAFNQEFSEIIEDHITAMEFRNPEDEYLPVISNSEFWRYTSFCMQFQKHIFYPGGN